MTTPADTAAPISAEGKTIFFTGATGYIGGTVLTALIGLSAPPSKITCLIRDPKKIELLKDVSVSAKTQLEGVQGSLSDVDVIVKAASEADVVVSCADCDDMTSIKAMLEGMKKRKKATGHRSLFIHTTGTAMFCDGAKGNYPNDKVGQMPSPTYITGSCASHIPQSPNSILMLLGTLGLTLTTHRSTPI
jgi:NAD(P)-dependent dehydrogenase (short-subunit alcohol dehydrogenase family)